MEPWQKLLQQSITSPLELPHHLACDTNALDAVIANFPMRINPYFLSLIKSVGDPLYRQAIPDPREITDSVCLADPLGEENLSPVPNLVHKYPDRVLLLVNSQCAMYCRFCTRKRKVGTHRMQICRDHLQAACEYLKRKTEIREVLISGGDPLLLVDEQLEEILSRLRQVPNIKIIRIGSRVPSVLPMRITQKLASLLARFHPLYINTHFNHPAEITPEAREACRLLADHGIPLGCQTVLLKEVNDQASILKELFYGLLEMRVKPYYLFQGDLTRGTDHFRTTVNCGLAIMRQLYGHISGMAIPTYALDVPGGGGKIPLTPDYIVQTGDELIVKTYQGRLASYPLPIDPPCP